LTPKTSTGPRYKLFPKHVLSYILKRSPGCFVWAVPLLLIRPLLYNIALGSWDLNPACVEASKFFNI
jgi:hypothetical protein